MTDKYQGTVKSAISFDGIGVHTSQSVTMTIYPASVNTGIVFVRTDLPESPQVPAHSEYITPDIMFSTALRKDDVLIRTTEHVLAALVGCHIDNAFIHMNTVECPIMDGSSVSFVAGIQKVGRQSQGELASVLRVKKKVSVGDESRWACLEPADQFKASVTCVHEHPAFQPAEQTVTYNENTDSFADTFLPARTFGFLKDHERAKQAGYALGSSLENTIVFDEEVMVNEEPLRFPDECARHKCLDAVGDLALLGHRLQTCLSSYCSGHAQTAELMRALLSDESQYEIENQ